MARTARCRVWDLGFRVQDALYAFSLGEGESEKESKKERKEVRK